MSIYNDLYFRVRFLIRRKKWSAAQNIAFSCIKNSLFVGIERIRMESLLAYIEFNLGNENKAAEIVINLVNNDENDIDRMSIIEIEHFEMIAQNISSTDLNKIIINLEKKYANGDIINRVNINAVIQQYKIAYSRENY